MVKQKHRCRICGKNQLVEFLSLGNIALPNGFLHSENLNKDEPSFPLRVGFCNNCFLVQILETVNPELMFRNYVYVPSSSQTRMRNFSQIATQAKKVIKLDETSLVVDLGSNDGSLLSFFKGYGIRTLGVDPAINLAKIAELKGIKTINDFISVKVANNIVRQYGNADVITATNVVAHIDDLHELFSSITILLSSSGIFICEFPYLLDLLHKKLFDTIYHEHLSYFSLHPLLYLLKGYNLKIIDLQRTDIDGGALRLTIASDKAQYPEAVSAISNLLALENKMKLDQLETFSQFAQEVFQFKTDIKKVLEKIKNSGHSIAGYGASARGNILLSYCEIGHETVDFIVDSTPYKQGLFTPGHHIPIFPEEALLAKQPDYTLLLAWNFVSEIVEKQTEYTKRGGKFIVPVPKIEIISKLVKSKKKLKVVVVMPAYNAAKTISASYKKIPKKLVDEIILVDDGSQDNTVEIARKLPITVFQNKLNLGYGGNLKVCLSKALEAKADIIIEYHPDDQYDPKDLHLFIQKAMDGYDFALGSRFISPRTALKNRMPLVKFIANRSMSFIDQLVLGIEMSEFHSGFRMYTKKLLEQVPFHQNSDDYLFSFEIIVQAIFWGYRVADIPISCRYHPVMHTADLRRSTIYALGTFKTLWQYVRAKFFHLQRGPFLLIEPAPCPLCKQKLTRFEYVVRDATSSEQFSIFFCTLCQAGFTIPVPKQLSHYYSPTYYNPLKTWMYQRLQIRRPALIQKLLKKGKLLDIGCGDGSLSQILDLRNYKYTGIESSFANVRNHLVKPVGIEGMREKNNSYHAAMFWESFEHLKEPRDVLKKAYKVLQKNRFLIIECPDYSSWERLLFGSHWFHLDPPRHLYHYTQKGLKKLVNEEGFTVIEHKRIYAFEYSPVGLAQSFLYIFSPWLSIFNKKQKYIRVLATVLLGLLSFIMIPVSYIFYIFDGSPIQLIVAKKNL